MNRKKQAGHLCLLCCRAAPTLLPHASVVTGRANPPAAIIDTNRTGVCNSNNLKRGTGNTGTE